MKWLLSVAASLILVGAGGLVIYHTAHSQGEAAGYDDGYGQGYAAGQETGYGSGETEGYDLGYLDGQADGYEEGAAAALGHGYNIQDPTYRQAVEFLREDDTDQNEFTDDAYVCSHFARDLCNSAESQGIRCAYVGLIYADGGHAIIAFNTIDQGLVYFDPQSDDEANPVVDKHYYECIVPKSGYYYEQPDYDDTILDILVIW
jgi:hypothetical protein